MSSRRRRGKLALEEHVVSYWDFRGVFGDTQRFIGVACALMFGVVVSFTLRSPMFLIGALLGSSIGVMIALALAGKVRLPRVDSINSAVWKDLESLFDWAGSVRKELETQTHSDLHRSRFNELERQCGTLQDRAFEVSKQSSEARAKSLIKLHEETKEVKSWMEELSRDLMKARRLTSTPTITQGVNSTDDTLAYRELNHAYLDSLKQSSSANER